LGILFLGGVAYMAQEHLPDRTSPDKPVAAKKKSETEDSTTDLKDVDKEHLTNKLKDLEFASAALAAVDDAVIVVETDPDLTLEEFETYISILQKTEKIFLDTLGKYPEFDPEVKDFQDQVRVLEKKLEEARNGGALKI
jgi:hypothetical protein